MAGAKATQGSRSTIFASKNTGIAPTASANVCATRRASGAGHTQ